MICLTSHPDIHFHPQNFEDRPFLLRAFCGRDAINRYAVLRASGYEIVPAFARCFGSVVIGPLESIRIAAESFEKTNIYKYALEEAVSALGPEALRREYAQRVSEAAEHAPPVSLTAERLTEAEADSRARTDAEEAKKLDGFIDSVRTVLRDRATEEAAAVDGGRRAAERLANSPHRNSYF